MSCTVCYGYAPSCPCCSEDSYEEETARCEYCLEHFDVRELTMYDGARACKQCAMEMLTEANLKAMREKAKAEAMLQKRFAFNSKELINCLI